MFHSNKYGADSSVIVVAREESKLHVDVSGHEDCGQSLSILNVPIARSQT